MEPRSTRSTPSAVAAAGSTISSSPREEQRLSAVAEAVIAIAREARIGHDPFEVFQVVATQVRRITGCECVALALPTEGGAHHVAYLDPADGWVDLREGGALDFDLVLRVDALDISTRVELDRDDGELSRALRANDFRTALLVPLALELGPPALLVLAGKNPDAFPAREAEIVAGLASHLSSALRARHLNQSLERAIAELERTRDYLVQSEMLRVAGEMASGVAHDFNNILGAVLGRAQLLRRQLERRPVPSEEIARALRIIEQVAQDGGETVRRLRLFGRAGEKVSLEPVDIGQALSDAIEFTRPRWSNEALAAGRAITVESDTPEGLWVEARPHELREVFTNLILNAVDALPHGGSVKVRAAVEGGRVVATVEDDGVGMDAETRKRLFEPFFTTKGALGTGLGMSVTYGIVQAHGGQIGVRTAPGAGTRIDIILPATRKRPGAPTPAPTASGHDESLDILVIDDELTVRDLIGDIARALGHRVTTIDNGLEALSEYYPGRFHLILTDVGMPGMTGWQVAEVVRLLDPGVMLAFVTGWSDDISDERLRTAHVDQVIPKPFTVEHVQEVIGNAIARLRCDRPTERADSKLPEGTLSAGPAGSTPTPAG
jgi:signal transduction histidine kinase/CheY-like chemotaxis protein